MTKAICGCRHSIKCVCIHCLSTASYGSALACPPLSPPNPLSLWLQRGWWEKGQEGQNQKELETERETFTLQSERDWESEND